MTTLDVVMIGAGRMGREHAAAVLAAGDRLVAFLDPSLASAESAAAEHGGEALAVGEDLAAALAPLARCGASAVVVASPSALHLDHAGVALALGLPVLLEKPPWVPGQDPAPLVAASRAGALLAVGMTTRFNPGVQAMRHAVRSGEIGALLYASDRVAFQLAPGDLGDWYFDPRRSGGGVLVTNGVHSLDRMGWILGGELALRGARLSSEHVRSCEDTAVLECRLGEAPVLVVELWGPGPVPPSEIAVVGTHGSCWTDAAGNWRLSSLSASRSAPRPEGWSELAAQWAAFRQAVAAGCLAEPLAGIEDLLAPMRLLEEAARS